jgi:Zn-dependent protease
MLGLDPSTLITYILVLLIAFPVHEFAHAWTADRFGDNTPDINGRLTLNPFAHLDLMGSLMLLFAGFGWAKPVPVNPYVLRRHSAAALMWVSLAGPLSNLLLAVLAAIPFRIGLISVSTAQYDTYTAGAHLLPTLPQFLWLFLVTNLTLMLFNLIPLAPLDGDKIADYLFPPPWARAWEKIRPYGPLILIGLLFVLPLIGVDVIGTVLTPLLNFMTKLLTG